ncbi:thioredoxin-dependent thiol peroxidase [Paenibacillus woosongensis]|uniref:thioredoxin-dependent peroxiredoxin n=1 Tax=Paenibacillus woosongensis TaxID=307580 RepID=A0AA95I9J2_9BACL|nr:thioredoxin-dependent thiol peroxidase [Paenibacillus woosongensis]WHX49879.1 thioredoxin-dependent thiol peroxidase [Paenibacillus woosongensis]
MVDMQVQVGEMVPDFQLPADGGEEIALSEFRGRKVVLYFYPRDMTPACTQQACDFRDQSEVLREQGAVVLGISGDSVKSHDKFKAKHGLTFPLLADEDHRVSRMFGVWQLKKLYGREYEGIVRSTFLIDEEGRLQKEWRGIRVAGHVEKVLEALRDDQGAK